MKPSGIGWAYAASVLLHAAVFAAASWFQVSAATREPAGFVEVRFVEAGGAVVEARDGTEEAEGLEEARGGHGSADGSREQVDREGEAPAEPRPIAKAARTSRKEPAAPVKDSQPEAPEENDPEDKHAEPRPGKGVARAVDHQMDTAGVENFVEARGGSSFAKASEDSSAGALPSPSVISEKTGPTVVRVVEPVYPRSARRAGHEGSVTVETAVLPDGRVGAVRVVESSGFEELDESAVTAAKRSRFAPGTLNGAAVLSSKRLVFRFVLEED